MSRLVVGVIGHVDHGKTALVRALTGEDTDRLPEEKARGISIALGFARLTLADGDEIDLIDMPGHERFVRTMISGATGLDAVLLVVAANEGIKPQTVEHVDIAGLLGLTRAVVAVTKADLVAPEAAARVGEAARDLLAAAGLEAPAPILTSAADGQGIEAVRAALGGLAAGQRPRAALGAPYLPIDRAFSMAGHGPVVTGTLRGGPVATGDVLELFPGGQLVRVRAVQVRGRRVDSAQPGQRVALNLRDVEAAGLKRGMALAAPGALTASEWLTLAIRAVPGAPPLKNGKRLRALLGTEELDVRLRLLDRDVLQPGEDGFAQLHCERPVATPAREHLVLRLASPALTVAGGRVLEPEARRLKRNSVPVLERLEALRTQAPPALVAAELARAGAAGAPLRQLARLSALAEPQLASLLRAQPVVLTKSGWAVAGPAFDQFLARIPALLAGAEDGLAPDQLREALPGTAAEVLDEAVTRLVADGVLARRGGRLVLPRPDQDRARAEGEAALAERVAEVLRAGGLSPPDPREVVTDLAAKRAVDRLLREGVAVRAVDRAKGKEILFHRDAVAEAQRRLAPLLERGAGLLVTEIAATLGVTRKYVMPLLDHLDGIRFTRRVGDRRQRGPGYAAALEAQRGGPG